MWPEGAGRSWRFRLRPRGRCSWFRRGGGCRLTRSRTVQMRRGGGIGGGRGWLGVGVGSGRSGLMSRLLWCCGKIAAGLRWRGSLAAAGSVRRRGGPALRGWREVLGGPGRCSERDCRTFGTKAGQGVGGGLTSTKRIPPESSTVGGCISELVGGTRFGGDPVEAIRRGGAYAAAIRAMRRSAGGEDPVAGRAQLKSPGRRPRGISRRSRSAKTMKPMSTRALPRCIIMLGRSGTGMKASESGVASAAEASRRSSSGWTGLVRMGTRRESRLAVVVDG